MSSFKNILVPTDFSSAAWHAVQISLGLVADSHSRITLLHVFPYSAKFDRRKGHLKDQDLEALELIKKQMDDFCLELGGKTKAVIASEVIAGGVESEILKFIANDHFDLIVMGVNSNGLDNYPGSHVTNIIEKAISPVLVVPNTQSQNQSA
jgi:nucleotide-binding universal stress UspA family protein